MAFTSWALTRPVRTAVHLYKENLCHIHQAAEVTEEEATVEVTHHQDHQDHLEFTEDLTQVPPDMYTIETKSLYSFIRILTQLLHIL